MTSARPSWSKSELPARHSGSAEATNGWDTRAVTASPTAADPVTSARVLLRMTSPARRRCGVSPSPPRCLRLTQSGGCVRSLTFALDEELVPVGILQHDGPVQLRLDPAGAEGEQALDLGAQVGAVRGHSTARTKGFRSPGGGLHGRAAPGDLGPALRATGWRSPRPGPRPAASPAPRSRRADLPGPVAGDPPTKPHPARKELPGSITQNSLPSDRRGRLALLRTLSDVEMPPPRPSTAATLRSWSSRLALVRWRCRVFVFASPVRRRGEREADLRGVTRAAAPRPPGRPRPDPAREGRPRRRRVAEDPPQPTATPRLEMSPEASVLRRRRTGVTLGRSRSCCNRNTAVRGAGRAPGYGADDDLRPRYRRAMSEQTCPSAPPPPPPLRCPLCEWSEFRARGVAAGVPLGLHLTPDDPAHLPAVSLRPALLRRALHLRPRLTLVALR